MGVEVYTLDGCIHCEHIKDFLENNKIKYQEKNVKQDEYYNELVNKGVKAVPFTVIKDKGYAGYDDVVKEVLLSYGK